MYEGYKAKRPQSITLLNLKLTQILSKGSILKVLSVSQTSNPYFAIVEQFLSLGGSFTLIASLLLEKGRIIPL